MCKKQRCRWKGQVPLPTLRHTQVRGKETRIPETHTAPQTWTRWFLPNVFGGCGGPRRTRAFHTRTPFMKQSRNRPAIAHEDTLMCNNVDEKVRFLYRQCVIHKWEEKRPESQRHAPLHKHARDGSTRMSLEAVAGPGALARFTRALLLWNKAAIDLP